MSGSLTDASDVLYKRSTDQDPCLQVSAMAQEQRSADHMSVEDLGPPLVVPPLMPREGFPALMHI